MLHNCIFYLIDTFPKALKGYYYIDIYKVGSCPILEIEKSKSCHIFQNQLIVEIAADQISNNRAQESQKRLFGYHLYQCVHFAEYVLISWN